jgi:hypothetical protein
MNDRDVKLAAQIVRWLDRERRGEGPMVAAGRLIERLDREVWAIFPDSRRFGRPAIRAAADPVERVACCRFNLARGYAIGNSEEVPALTAASRVLLGDPCTRCMTRIKRELVARVVDAPKQALANTNAIVASAAKVNFHPFPLPCVTCHSWQQAARSALRASAEIPKLPWHKARPAASGPVRTVKPKAPARYLHDLEGAVSCNCTTCLDKRRARRSRPSAEAIAKGRWAAGLGPSPTPADPTDRSHANAARGARR